MSKPHRKKSKPQEEGWVLAGLRSPLHNSSYPNMTEFQKMKRDLGYDAMTPEEEAAFLKSKRPKSTESE